MSHLFLHHMNIKRRIYTGRVYLALLIITGIFAATCVKVSELDDHATIKSVEIESVKPSAIIIGTPEIGINEVEIPLIFGKYLFPIEVELNISTQQEIDKILGLNDNNKLVFTSLEDLNRVDLIALSGVVHSYTFKLQEVPSREDANIEQFKIVSWTPEQALFTKFPYYDLVNGAIEIIGINNLFPFSITPDISVSEGAHLENYTSGEPFHFSSYATQFSLKVVAESGKERDWLLKIKQAQVITPSEAPDTDIRERLSFSQTDMSALLTDAQSQIESIQLDSDNSTIRIAIKQAGEESSWNAQLSFSQDSYAQTVGYASGDPLQINGWGVQKSFYLVDMLSAYASEWKIESVKWYDTTAEVESFQIDHYESAYSLIELGTPVLHSDIATIEIPVIQGFDFPLTIDTYKMTISKDAAFTEVLPEKLIFEDFDTQYPITVKAQSGDVKNWKITISDARSGNNEAKVIGYAIKSYSGTSQTANNLILSPQVDIDQTNKTITFHILDWPNKLPLHVQGHVEISPGATLTPFTFTADHELTFNTLTDTHSFTIVSENGDTEQSWSILLQNDTQPKSDAKEVLDFVSGAPSSGFAFAEKYIEPQKRQITLVMSGRLPGSPLLLAPRISVSPQARLSGIVSGAQTALYFDQPKTFTVQAEDESVAEWSIVLVYAPQIPNSDFESWGKANNNDMNLLPANGTGWCTANNSAVTGTTRVAGYNSPYAAQLQTQMRNMNFVIFRITSITSGSAFLGKFTLRTGVNDVFNPISMTAFGIPWAERLMPMAFSLDYKYLRGAQLMYTEPKWGSLIPSFKDAVNLPGTDAASMKIELFYHPSGTFDYVTASNNNEMIATGIFKERGDVPNWTHVEVPVSVLPGKEGLAPTHICVMLASSEGGQEFKGAPGSTLTVDNFALIYYKPEAGARRLE